MSRAKRQRRLSPEAVRSYVFELVQRHGATRLAVLDELVNLSAGHLDALLDAVESEGVPFDIPNGLRADRLQRQHLARLRGRVTTVSISAESGSPRVLSEVIGKDLALGEVTRVAEEARSLGLPVLVHFLIGLPGETAEEVNDTLSFAAALQERTGAWPSVQFATPLPGTPLARGVSLPVVDDWGPRFQTAPTELPGALPPETLQRFKQAFDLRMEAARGPSKLILNVTYACNNRCVFCAVGNRTPLDGNPSRQREHLERYRARGVTRLDLDGGEPTLHPALLPLIRYARAIGYERVHLTTNGRRCAYETFAARLMRSGLTSALFSLHGADAATHAKIVGVPEAFEQTTAGIRHAVKHAPPGVELGLNVTLTRDNVVTLGDLVELAWSLGLRWANLQFITPFGRATRETAPDTEQALSRTRDVLDRWRDRMKLQVVNLPWCFLPGYERFLLGDQGKLHRRMVFVNNDDVNLGGYLAARRVRAPECASCPYALVCDGYYALDDTPEPAWVIHPEDLDRPGPQAVARLPPGRGLR